MQLAFSSNAYLRFSIEETIARIAALGYRGIELLADVPHAWPAGLLESQKQAIRDALAKHEPHDLEHQRLHDERDRRPAAAVLAPELDRSRSALPRDSPRAHQAVAATGRRSGRTAHHDRAGRTAVSAGRPGQSAADIFYEELMPCVEIAEALGMPLLIEPEPDLLIERFAQYLSFVERIDSPHGRASTSTSATPTASAKTRKIGSPKWRPTRVTITSKTSPPHASISISCRAAGRSTSPPRSPRSKKTGYDGWLTVELYPYLDDPDAAAREAREYLSKSPGPVAQLNRKRR